MTTGNKKSNKKIADFVERNETPPTSHDKPDLDLMKFQPISHCHRGPGRAGRKREEGRRGPGPGCRPPTASWPPAPPTFAPDGTGRA
jgi:hypothetical protein